MRRLLFVILDYLRSAVLFLLASTGIAALAVVLLSLIGYVSFGDRPGTGWYGIPQHVTREAILRTGVSALALPVFGAIPVLILFVIPYAAVHLLRITRLHRWISQIVGGLLCGALALIVISMSGWYIALGAFPAYAGILGGVLYGGFILARSVVSRVPLPA
jgi:hypothetical protein